MIRNLVLKLPSFSCTSEYAFTSSLRHRGFRSLSSGQRSRPTRTEAISERSLSCSRVESRNSVDDSFKPPARTFCYSKEYYAKSDQDDNTKEIKWRESPICGSHRKDEDFEEDLLDVNLKRENTNFETLEQYELEAARPRPKKSTELFQQFEINQRKKNDFVHLQPCELRSYGSRDNLYSPSLIKPTSCIRYTKKFKTAQQEEKETENKNTTESDNTGHRNYSTLTSSPPDEVQKMPVSKKTVKQKKNALETTGKFIESEDLNKADKLTNSKGLHPKYAFQSYKSPWAEPKPRFEICPPKFQTKANPEDRLMDVKCSSPEMRRLRRERENNNISTHYKSCYSDQVKIKLKQKDEKKLSVLAPIEVDDKMCVGCMTKSPKNKMLEVSKLISEKRNLTTRSKSNILSKYPTPVYIDTHSKNVLLGRKTADDFDQKNYSKSKSRIECDNICSELKRQRTQKQRKSLPYEPKPCVEPSTEPKKVFLPSKVKLQVPPCTARPDYKDCKKIDPCPPRADECLEIEPKKLPVLLAQDCPCIEPEQPRINPKLEKLHFKFEDPPRKICHIPPCTTPRADDKNPYQYKPLKPYVPGECACVEPPPMSEVKLKRLPRCAPEDVCRPIRVCPMPEPCPPRADECLVIEPKKLPILEGSPCPCIEPEQPRKAPLLPRLDLHVAEPPRECYRPPPCDERPRADDNLKMKKKRLPKFVPGDCPCEDRPILDWKFKRLRCLDEPQDCIVPDPCKAFPRADWGCWEYSQDECVEVDEKCIGKPDNCLPPQKEKDPCEKRNICKTAGPLDIRYTSKRKYNTNSASMKLFERVKTQNINQVEKLAKDVSVIDYRPPSIKESNEKSPTCSSQRNTKRLPGTKKVHSEPTLDLLKQLIELEVPSRHNLKFSRPKKTGKVDYKNILKAIASSSIALEKTTSKSNTVPPKRPSITISVSSRAISTSNILSKDESDIKNEKSCKVKEKCKTIKPSLKAMCNRPCASFKICPSPGREHRPSCRTTRVPVCCEKEDPPYEAFSDKARNIPPYSTTSQWTCDRKQYGFHPNYKKEFEPLDNTKKEKKKFSTSTLVFDLPMYHMQLNENRPKSRGIYPIGSRPKSNGAPWSTPSKQAKAKFKSSLKKHKKHVYINQSQSYASNIFQIQPPPAATSPKPGKDCVDKSRDKGKADKITCIKVDDCAAIKRWCCKREYTDPNTKRTPAPFPAFSDCLDEEMEAILTECPLDKEKYLRMQPRFMNPPEKPLLLKPPPPSQGKLDLLKEQECLREKLCMENEGLSQSCKDFGKPVSLMKTKNMITERNLDCERIEELKKLGRWPPFTLKQNRRSFSSFSAMFSMQSRNISTVGLNIIQEVSKDVPKSSKRIYIRNYHGLMKSPETPVFADIELKVKEMTYKLFPDAKNSYKLLKLKNKRWRITNLNKYSRLNGQSNVARRVKHFYCTYKTKHKNFLKRHSAIDYSKNEINKRKVSNNQSLLKSSTGEAKDISIKTQKHYSNFKSCRGQPSKKTSSKFTLSNCPSKSSRASYKKRSCARPFSPCSVFSECTDQKSLQPSYPILPEIPSTQKKFPSQEVIDRSFGYEYYKCKHGVDNKGQTLDCDTFGEYVTAKRDGKLYIKKAKNKEIIECLVEEHKNKDYCDDEVTCCSHSKKYSAKEQNDECEECEEDSKKILNICIERCMQCPPCCLPEEEKYKACKEECEKIFQQCQPMLKEKHEACKEECESEFQQCENMLKEKDKTCKEECKNEFQQCQTMLKENDKTCKEECEKEFQQCQPMIKEEIKKDCEPLILKNSNSNKNCTHPKKSFSASHITSECKKIKQECPPVRAVVCQPKSIKNKTFPQIDTIWQKVVNYFKARPNCPAPGEWKKKALKEKAEKAAKAAGLVVLDPKCIPTAILKNAKVEIDCKVCPKQSTSKRDICEKKEGDSNKKSSCEPPSTPLSKRQFSTIVQSRHYSRNLSCKNLEEINKMLEEAEVKRKELRIKGSIPNHKKEFRVLGGKDNKQNEEIKMSLDVALKKSVNTFYLCQEEGRRTRTYFGYSNIIPCRENILERAWRTSMEAYSSYNRPKSCYSFNEIFKKVETSVQNFEDLEKLKTENVLKELDEILKNADSTKNKK